MDTTLPVTDTPAGSALMERETKIFTRDDLSAASSQLPVELVTDDSAYEYEKTHLPDGAWPPTEWFDGWASGLDLFDVEREESPIELRWLVYQKT